MTLAPHAFFMPVEPKPGGQRFCLFHAAQGQPRGRVVYVAPFAEEMNKARRMAALQSRALAEAGFSVLQIDLQGCGDSSGDFADASWQGWVSDVVLACRWLRDHNPEQAPLPLWLWGLRAGCLLATAAAAELDEDCNFCFWQPVFSGKLALTQFMRLKLAAEMANGSSGSGKSVMDRLHQHLEAGPGVEIAGYMLTAAVATGLREAQLNPPPHTGGARAEWFDISAREDAVSTPAAEQAAAQWRNASVPLRQHHVSGPAFWQTTEIEDAPALIAATIAALTTPPALTSPATPPQLSGSSAFTGVLA